FRAKCVELTGSTERCLRVRTQGKTPCSFSAAAHRLAKARELSGIHDPRPVYELQPQLQAGVARGAAAAGFLPATGFGPVAQRPDGLAAFRNLAQKFFYHRPVDRARRLDFRDEVQLRVESEL